MFKNYILYNPTSTHRYIPLKPNDSIRQINFQVYWQNKNNNNFIQQTSTLEKLFVFGADLSIEEIKGMEQQGFGVQLKCIT